MRECCGSLGVGGGGVAVVVFSLVRECKGRGGGRSAAAASPEEHPGACCVCSERVDRWSLVGWGGYDIESSKEEIWKRGEMRWVTGDFAGG